MSVGVGSLRLGDLITHDWEYGNHVYEKVEGNYFKNPLFRFEKGDIGMIIGLDKSKFPGVKIVLSDGRIGWIDGRFFDKLN